LTVFIFSLYNTYFILAVCFKANDKLDELKFCVQCLFNSLIYTTSWFRKWLLCYWFLF